jgi:hypothetical protein
VKAQQANCMRDRFDACVRKRFRVFTNRKHQSKFEGICQNINLSPGLCQVGNCYSNQSVSILQQETGVSDATVPVKEHTCSRRALLTSFSDKINVGITHGCS